MGASPVAFEGSFGDVNPYSYGPVSQASRQAPAAVPPPLAHQNGDAEALVSLLTPFHLPHSSATLVCHPSTALLSPCIPLEYFQSMKPCTVPKAVYYFMVCLTFGCCQGASANIPCLRASAHAAVGA